MIKLFGEVNLTGFALIVPAVAVGNVAQLAVDLLIYNRGMKKIGQLLNPDFIPFLGPNPYDEDSPDICTATDFYIDEEKKIILLQIRSPPSSNRLDDFFKEIASFVKEHNISKVIIFTSKWQFTRVDSQLTSEALRYVVSPAIEAQHGQMFNELGWKKLEESQVPLSDETRLEINGGGFALSLFQFLSDREVACVILLKFASEGNNGPDAKELASYFNSWMPLVPKNSNKLVDWKEPPSWQYVFGHNAPRQIY